MSMLQGNGAVVVAHPDDETLWAGSFINAHPGITVICCTVPRRDPERAIRFFDACRVLGAFPVLIPFVEPDPTLHIDHLDLISLDWFDFVVTHNSNGEYGHVHHKDVHDYVMSEADCPVYTFGYNHPGGKGFAVDVSPEKEKALMMYDHQSPTDGGKPKWVALMDTYNIPKDKEHFYAEC